MLKLNRLLKDTLRQAREFFGARESVIRFSGQSIKLDLKWKHERNYYNYIKSGAINGPLGMDVWVLSRFVKPGGIALDAGANIGFTCLLMKAAGAEEVHGFEPDPRLIPRLKDNCGESCIFIHGKALGETQTTMTLRMSTAHNQGSTFSDVIVDRFPTVFEDAKSVLVDVVAIDDYFQGKHFNLFKIDVEGAELSTLRGARSTLQKDCPDNVYIEVYDDFFHEVHEYLRDFYAFSYRVVCDHSGRGRLFPIGCDVSELDANSLYTMPPSYIYSNVDQVELTQHWTTPLKSNINRG